MLYLRLHFSKTHKLFIEFMKKHNEQLKKENPKDFKKNSLKKTHKETFFTILNAYQKHLDKNRKMRLDPETPFRINNVALGTMACADNTTMFRHIKRLMAAGVITKKVFHGSNSSYELHLNLDLLIAEDSLELTHLIKEKHRVAVSKGFETEETLVNKLAQNCTFSFIKFYMVAFCDDIVSGSLQETLNNNMDCEDVLITFNEDEKHLDKKQGSIQTGQNIASFQHKELLQETKIPAAAAVSGNANERHLAFLVDRAWIFCYSVLWQGKKHVEQEVIQAKRYISLFFTGTKYPGHRLEMFCERVLLARKYCERSPERFIPTPSTWLDPYFANGFAGTKNWHEKVIKKREKQKEYYGDLKLLAAIFREYSNAPTANNYRIASQLLGKKGKDELLDTFNTCVLNKDLFNSQTFQNLHQQYVC